MASVICRQLGAPRAIRTYSYIGEAHIPQHVRGVSCTGDEATIEDCAYSSEGDALCSHDFGDVGIECAQGRRDAAHLGPCGSGRARSIRNNAAEARAFALHGALAAGNEPYQSFDGRRRFASGGVPSHGRLRLEPGSEARTPSAWTWRQAGAAGGVLVAGILAVIGAHTARGRRLNRSRAPPAEGNALL